MCKSVTIRSGNVFSACSRASAPSAAYSICQSEALPSNPADQTPVNCRIVNHKDHRHNPDTSTRGNLRRPSGRVQILRKPDPQRIEHNSGKVPKYQRRYRFLTQIAPIGDLSHYYMITPFGGDSSWYWQTAKVKGDGRAARAGIQFDACGWHHLE